MIPVTTRLIPWLIQTVDSRLKHTGMTNDNFRIIAIRHCEADLLPKQSLVYTNTHLTDCFEFRKHKIFAMTKKNNGVTFEVT